MMYFFRPNTAAKQRMKEQLQEIIPDWLDPQDTVGMPIRGMLHDSFIPGIECCFLSTAPLLPFIHALQHLLL
jgi:hypothetical protein